MDAFDFSAFGGCACVWSVHSIKYDQQLMCVCHICSTAMSGPEYGLQNEAHMAMINGGWEVNELPKSWGELWKGHRMREKEVFLKFDNAFTTKCKSKWKDSAYS